MSAFRIETNARQQFRVTKNDGAGTFTPVSEPYATLAEAIEVHDSLVGETTWRPMTDEEIARAAVGLPAETKTRA